MHTRFCQQIIINGVVLQKKDNAIIFIQKRLLRKATTISAEKTTDTSNGVYGFAMCAVSTEEGTFQILPWIRSVENGKSVNVDDITADSAVNGLQTLGDFVTNGYMSRVCKLDTGRRMEPVLCRKSCICRVRYMASGTDRRYQWRI